MLSCIYIYIYTYIYLYLYLYLSIYMYVYIYICCDTFSFSLHATAGLLLVYFFTCLLVYLSLPCLHVQKRPSTVQKRPSTVQKRPSTVFYWFTCLLVSSVSTRTTEGRSSTCTPLPCSFEGRFTGASTEANIL